MTDDTTPNTDDVTDDQCEHGEFARGVFVAGTTGAGRTTVWREALFAQADDEVAASWIDPAGRETDLPDDLSGLTPLDVNPSDEEPPAGGDA